jgi:hypothetical protein
LFIAVECLYVLRTKNWRRDFLAFAFAALILLLLILGSVYVQYLPSALISLLAAAYVAFWFVKNVTRIATLRWASTGLLFVLLIYASGVAVGQHNKETPGFKRDVYLHAGDPIRDVGLVMITSRYVLLYTGDHSIILPAGDVTKIEARPQHTTD